MLRRMYDWCIAAAGNPTPLGLWGPSPSPKARSSRCRPMCMLVPMSLARPDRAFYYATICTITSVCGGVLGYLIGHLLYDSVGAWVIEFYGSDTKSKSSASPIRSTARGSSC